MKTQYDRLQFDCLSGENIRKAVDTANVFFSDNGIESEHITRGRLLLEDLLLAYRKLDDSAAFSVVFKRSWTRVKVTVRVGCTECNVLADYTDMPGHRQGLGTYQPAWEYKKGENSIIFYLPVKVPDMESLKYLFRFMGKERGAFRQGVVIRLLNIVLLVLEPWMAARIIESFNAADIHGIVVYAACFLGMDAGSSLLNYIGTRCLQRAYNTMRENMRTEAAEMVLRIKTEHINDLGTGVFTERLVRDTAKVIDGIDDMVWIFSEAFRLLSLLIAFTVISPLMLVYELALFMVYVVLVRVQAKKKNENFRRLYAATEAYSGFVGEMVHAALDIKLLHSEDGFLGKMKDVTGSCTDRERESAETDNRHLLVRKQFVSWTSFFYLILLAVLMSGHGLLPATALILYNYNGKVFVSIRAVAGAVDASNRLILSSERVYQLMNSSDFAREVFGQKSLRTVNGEIELKNVGFAYRSKGHLPVSVLKDISLRVPAGGSAALIGRSGCGKSTILSLISRLYDPACGSILLDGMDVRELDMDTLRDNIGIVTQSPYLFNMSLRDNFRLIRSDATDEDIVNVCKTACVHDDIMNLPKGYDTIIGEGGKMLSGGQRQRIALARALLKDYPVIMLDEATSALDNETQTAVRDAISNMHGGRTVIMVAHRLSTVVNCEQLFYIQDGKVLASGTHDELLKTCEPYRKMYAEETAVPGNDFS